MSAQRSANQRSANQKAAKRPAGRSRGTGGDLFTPRRITLGLLIVLAVVFIFENTRTTTIRLLIPEVSMPLWLALLAMGLAGAAGVLLYSRRR